MKIFNTLAAFSYKRSCFFGAQRNMKMLHVIPDLIRNPGVRDWMPACAGMTMYFHINSHTQMEHNKR